MSELQQKTFGKISCANSGRIECLNIFEHGLDFGFGKISPDHDLSQWNAKITIIIQVADDQTTKVLFAIAEPGQGQLPEEMLLERRRLCHCLLVRRKLIL